MKNVKFLSFLIAILSAFIFLLAGSATSEPFVTPSFNWSAKSNAAPGSANITIALIEPSYIINWGGSVPEPFKSYQKSLEADYLEMLTEKGFTVRGPFEARDEMVYSDKEACDIILSIDIDPQFKTATGGWKSQFVKCANGEIMYKYVGSMAMYGKINLVASEPISGEKVWSKSIDIPEGNTGEIKSNLVLCGGGGTLLDLIAKDATVANPFTTMLQANYEDVLDKCDRLVEPVEFQKLVPQIQKLKNN